MRITFFLCLNVYLAFSAMSVAALPSQNVRVVAVTGETAGLSQGIFQEFETPVINDQGSVAFVSRLVGIPGVANVTTGLFVEQDELLQFITRTGFNSPQGPEVIGSLYRPSLAANGDVLVRGSFEKPGAFERMLLTNVGGSLRVVASEFDYVPAAGASMYLGSDFREPRFSTSGMTAFAVNLTLRSTPKGMSVWRDRNGILEVIAQESQSAPMTDSSTLLRKIAGDTVVVNSAGHVAFSTSFSGPNVTSDNASAIYSSNGSDLRLVARRGDPAPGFSTDERLGLIGEFLTINGKGEVAFQSTVQSQTGPRIDVIYAERDGQLRLVAKRGMAMPGFANVNFYDSMNTPVINDRSEVAFFALLEGPGVASGTDESIWSEGLGGLHAVARRLDQAVGAEPGVLYDGFFSASPYLSSRGQTAFMGGLRGAGVSAANDRAIWAEDLSGSLRMLVREGDSIEIGPGDVRTIELLLLTDNTFYGSGNNDGLRSPFNNRGQLVFQAYFDDGSSAILVSNVAAIPEPMSLSLIVMAWVIAVGYRSQSENHARAQLRSM